MTKEDNEEESLALPLSCPPPHPPLPAVLALGVLSQLSPPLFLKPSVSSLKIRSHVNQNHFLSFKVPRPSFTPLETWFFLHQTTSDKVRQRRHKKVFQCYDNLNTYSSLSLLGKTEVSTDSTAEQQQQQNVLTAEILLYAASSWCVAHGFEHSKETKGGCRGGWKNHTRRPKVLFRTEHTPRHQLV